MTKIIRIENVAKSFQELLKESYDADIEIIDKVAVFNDHEIEIRITPSHFYANYVER